MPRFVGPCEVLERVGPVSSHLRLPASLAGRVFPVFHVSKLRAYRDDGGEDVQPVEPILVEGKEEYEIEKIVA